MRFIPVRVKTRDEVKIPGVPKYVEIEGENLEITSIEQQWHEAYQDPTFYPMEYFKVTISSGKRYILRYSTLFKSWGIAQYQKGKA